MLTATLGTGTGAVLGLFLGWALVTSVKVTSASAPGAVGVVSVPWPQVVAILLIGVAAGLLAAHARPAGRPGSTRSPPSPSHSTRSRSGWW